MFRYRPLTLALLAALAHSGAQAEGSDAQRLLIEQGHFWQAQDKPKRAGEVWQKLLLIDAAQPDALYGLGFISVKDGILVAGVSLILSLSFASSSPNRWIRTMSNALTFMSQSGSLPWCE